MNSLITRPAVIVAMAIASLLAATPARAQVTNAPLSPRLRNSWTGFAVETPRSCAPQSYPAPHWCPLAGPGLGAPSAIDGISERTGKGTGPGNDERIERPKVQIDEQLA
jgi:hypothetical protein